MVSRKRSEYVNSVMSESEESTDSDSKQSYYNDAVSTPDENMSIYSSRKRKSTSYSKNAVMARENRRKKKMYLQSLEGNCRKLNTDNKRLRTALTDQLQLVNDLTKQVSYLRSVLANSTDITKILRSINTNTGMSATTSMGKPAFTSNVSKPAPPMDSCIWNDVMFSTGLSLDFDDGFADSDLTFPSLETEADNKHFNMLEEHNYTVNSDLDNNAGVCLHVSKHRVSLEFCSTCSDNAKASWKEQDEEK